MPLVWALVCVLLRCTGLVSGQMPGSDGKRVESEPAARKRPNKRPQPQPQLHSERSSDCLEAPSGLTQQYA